MIANIFIRVRVIPRKKKLNGSMHRYLHEYRCINPDCDNILSLDASKYNNCKNSRKKHFLGCCRSCASVNAVTEMRGTINPFKVKNQPSVRAGVYRKYGVENPFQSEEVKLKIKETNLLRHGVENPQKNKDIREKTSRTSIERYGVSVAANSEENLEKKKRKHLELYGVEHFFQSKQFLFAMSLEGHIHKYGEEEGKLRYESYCASKAITIENLRNKHGDKAEIVYAKWLSEVSRSKENFIKKYGEEEGLRRFFSMLEKRKKSFVLSSKLENDFLSYLPKGKTQLMLPDRDNNIYFYDYSYKNKIIEINGDYWHANPKKYSLGETISYPNKLMIKAEEVWARDYKKFRCAIDIGYDVLYIWESDINENLNKQIQKAMEHINAN